MAQLPCIGCCMPCINLPFGDCALYFDQGVNITYIEHLGLFFFVRRASVQREKNKTPPKTQKGLSTESSNYEWYRYLLFKNGDVHLVFIGYPK